MILGLRGLSAGNSPEDSFACCCETVDPDRVRVGNFAQRLG
jgi:hypothetical protein